MPLDIANRRLPERSTYRRDGDLWLIELKLREPRQLFHTLDPAPFHEKDLDPAAEQYIEDAVREIGQDKPMKLIVHLPAAMCDSDDAHSLPQAVANYFDSRARQARVDLRRLLSRGGLNLAIGVGFLIACLWLRRLMIATAGFEVLAEGLLIIGWVGLWRPVEIFLYDWWPIRRQQQRFAAVARMPILIVPEG
ncbi:MAG: hypothetical protein JSR15_04720 [Proteobacteria bacterium]|nr:hypothetical protein [Pseudomonadota bacterium]